MNFTYFTAPSRKKNQIVATEVKGLPAVAVHEDQPFVDLLPFPAFRFPRPTKWGEGQGEGSPLSSQCHDAPQSFVAFVSFCSKSLFLAGALLLLGLATSVQAQFTFTTNNGTITITGYTGTNTVLAIPGTIDDLPVTDIGTNAFQFSALTSVLIPDNVTNIGDYAFFECQALTNVTMAEGLASIGASAFSGEWNGHVQNQTPSACPLTSITIPSSVTNIGPGAFANCLWLTNVDFGEGLTTIGPDAFWNCLRLTNVTFGVGLTTIGADAFADCGLTNAVTIPDSVTNIGTGAFWDAWDGSGLMAINVASANPAYSSLNGVLFNKTQTTLLQYPGGLGGSYTLPNSVTSIGDYAFGGSELATVSVPASVTNIGEYAFSNDPLTNAYFLGNAPTADSTVSSGAGLTAYYLPGTTGWANFAANTGVPTALWTLLYPLVLNGSSGVQANQFGFTISWATNVPVVVEASTDLFNPVWTPIATNTLTGGTSAFSDPKWTNYPARFYRLRAQ